MTTPTIGPGRPSSRLPRNAARQLRVKYAFDRIVGILLTVILGPVLLLIGLSIRIVDGKPVLFRQARAGRDEEPFDMLKFRTMKVDADQMLDEQGRPTGNRLTRTGKFLRSTSLDELPNALNVAAGDMSIVGPRPTLPHMRDVYGIDDDIRFAVKPGITGLAQVSGRNSLPWRERLRLDAEYVRGYSLVLDAKIILKSIKVVLLREGVQLDRNPEANLGTGGFDSPGAKG